MKKEYIEAAQLAIELKVGVREFEQLVLLFEKPLGTAELTARSSAGTTHRQAIYTLRRKGLVEKIQSPLGPNYSQGTTWKLSKKAKKAFERRDG